MTAWNEWAFNFQQHSAHKYFEDEEIPDSIQLKELCSIVLICLNILSLSVVLFGLEIIHKFLKLSRQEKCFVAKCMKHQLKICMISLRFKVIEIVEVKQ